MMASTNPVVNGMKPGGGSSILEGDHFERELQEMLDDRPSLNDSLSAIHSGSSSPPGRSVRPQSVSPSFQPVYSSPANTTVSLSTPSPPSQNGEQPRVLKPQQSKIDSIRQWSISTYKCTRQIISEKLGKTSRTVDAELESQIEALRDTQRRYGTVLRLSRAMSSHFYHMMQTQGQLGEVFAELGQKSPELREEFMYNADTQRSLSRNGETLLNALNFFVSTVNTLCNKTIEDTLITVRQYETARVEFDAYRSDLEFLNQQPRTEVNAGKIDDAQKNYEANKERFDRLRQDVAIKLKFLEENKVKVMHKQLLLFHNAISAYFSGNQQALETTLKQFNIKSVKTGGSC